MPPVHAIAARRVFEYATDGEEARTWLEDLALAASAGS